MAIIVTLRTLPGTAARADAGVAVQGIDDVAADRRRLDRRRAGWTPTRRRLVGLSGHRPGSERRSPDLAETFRSVTGRLRRGYRFVVKGRSATHRPHSCSGSRSIGVRRRRSRLAGLLTATRRWSMVTDGDHDGRSGSRAGVGQDLAGPEVFIMRSSKNLNRSTSTHRRRRPIGASTNHCQPGTEGCAGLTAGRNPLGPAHDLAACRRPRQRHALRTTLDGRTDRMDRHHHRHHGDHHPTCHADLGHDRLHGHRPRGLSAASTISVASVHHGDDRPRATTTTTPPPCVVSNMTVSPARSPSPKATGKLKSDVRVTVRSARATASA